MKNETILPSATEQAIAKIEFTDTKAFESIVAAINGLANKYRGLKITDTASYKVVVSGIAEMRNLRISVESRRKEKKADILVAGRQIDSGAKKIAELLLPIEKELKDTKDAEDTRKEAIKTEKDRLEKERIESIQAKIAAFPPDVSKLPQLLKMTAPEIQEMQDTLTAVEIDLGVFQEFTPEAIKTKEEKKKLLQEYYIARIQADAETAKQRAEIERQEQVRKEQEAAQKTENDRLAKIREEQEAEADKLLAEQERIEADRQAVKEGQDRLENERLERERIEQEKLAQEKKVEIAPANLDNTDTKLPVKLSEKTQLDLDATEVVTAVSIMAAGKPELATTTEINTRTDKETLELYQGALAAKINGVEIPLVKTPEGKIVLSFIQTSIEKVFADTLGKLADM